MMENELFKDILSYSGMTDEQIIVDSSTMMPVSYPNRRNAKAKRILQGRVLEVKESVFLAELEENGNIYNANIKIDRLDDYQRGKLAKGIEFTWTVRHDYRKDKNRTRAEIVFDTKVTISHAVLMKKKEEAILKYRHFFIDND